MTKKRIPKNKTDMVSNVDIFSQAYSIMVENAPDGIAVIQDGIIRFANQRHSEISGYTVEELVGKLLLDLVPAESTSMVREKFSQHEQDKNISKTFGVRLLCKGGAIKETEFSTRLIQYQGKLFYIATIRDITERKQEEERFQQTINSLRKAVDTTIQVLVSAMESREPYMTGHQSRAANLACAIATEMGLDQEKIEGIRMAGVIHDIGKLTVPVEVLAKPTKLSELGFALVKEHARSGYEVLKNVGSPWPLAQIVHQHHERMNGSGYPRKLKGDEILIEARILAVADVVEAMASHRPYRSASSINVALEEIEKNKGILYDSAVADACLRLFREKGYQLA